MKKITLVAALFFSLLLLPALAPAAQEGNSKADAQATPDKSPKDSFRSFVFSTRMDIGLDWWGRVPLNSAKITTTSEVYPGDAITIIPLALNFTSKPDEPYSLKITARGGKKGSLEDIGVQYAKGTWWNPHNIRLLSESLIMIRFGKEDEPGPQEIVFEIENEKTGEKSTATAEINFVEWESPKPIEDANELNKTIYEFNSNLSPKTLYSIFMSPHLSFMQRGPWHGLNPAMYSFFKYAFQANKFLLPILRKEFDSASPQQRENMIVLFGILGEPEFEKEKMTPDEVVLQSNIREMKFDDDPYKEIKAPSDLDLLWGEFEARGTYAPARRVLDALLFEEERNFADERMRKKDINKNDPAQVAKLMKGLSAMAAEWSVVSNTRNELFGKYLTWAVKNDVNSRLGDAIGSLFERARVKAEASKALKKKEEKKAGSSPAPKTPKDAKASPSSK